MQRVWRRTMPSISRARSASSAMKGRYGHTCAEESRSHIAGISPVTTTVSGPLLVFVKVTVVSSVLGRQLEKSHASSGSRIRDDTDSIAASTALLRKRRSEGAVRLEVKPDCAREKVGAIAAMPTVAAALTMKLRRETCAKGFICNSACGLRTVIH